jgi:peroxiredoxin (alkyl hydroperoxide reductase subunit C)
MRNLAFVVFLLFIGCAIPRVSSHPDREQQAAPPVLPSVSKPWMVPTLVTQEAPDFTAEAVMPDHSFQELTLSSYRGKYVVLFFYPLDFTVVCPTEIILFNDKLKEFKENNCEVIGISTDSKYTHLAWRNTPLESGGIGRIQYPLVSDIKKEIARSYGVLHDESIALRGLFLIDTRGRVRHALVNDLPVGRSVDEALRVLRAVQLVDQYGEFCPANWKPGDPSIKTAREYMEEYLSRPSK